MPLVPMVVEQSARGERSFDIYSRLLNERDRLPRHAGRRRGREPDRRAAAAPRVRGPRQGHLALHQLARRRRLRGPRDLRHDAVHQARRADDLLRHRDVDGLAAARRRRAGQADGAAERAHPDPPAAAAASRARRPTSRSTRARCSSCARRSTRSTPHHTGQTVEQVHDDMDRDRFFTAEQAREYGLIDRVIESHELSPRAGGGLRAHERRR